MDLVIGLLIVCGIVLLISKVADVAHRGRHFWLFLALTI